MKKLTRSLLVLFLIVMVVGCGSNELSEKEKAEYTTGMKFVDLLDENTYEKNGSKMVKALENALNATPNDFHMIVQKGKLLSRVTYFEETFDVTDYDYYYIGKIKDGKPDGYGVITNNYDTSEMDIYYIGEFHSGEVENCYGMRLEGGYFGKPYAIAYEGEIAYLSSDGLYPVPADGERVITYDIDSIYNWYSGEISILEDAPSKTKVARCFPEYIGEIKKGEYNGKGIEYYPNGAVYYEGEYKSGLRHGEGKTYSSDGYLLEEGEYKRGELEDGKIYREPQETKEKLLEDYYETESAAEDLYEEETIVNETQEASQVDETTDWIIPENTWYAWDINYGDIIISFLNDETMGWYINDDSVGYFSDLLVDLEDGNTIQITGYTIVDMDSDLQPEVVLMLEGMLDGYYLVLHYNNQDEELPIDAVIFGYRGMSQLQQNGVYVGSSGADTYGYYICDFGLDREFQEIEFAKAENGQYFVQSEAVTKDEFDGYYQNVLADYMVEWRDYSLATLAEEVRASWIPEDDIYDNSEFILEGSDQYYLERYELEGLTAEECKIARNEIYARHGRMFNDAELQEYFNSCSWYAGYISAEDFNEDILSDVEKSNRDLIIEYEAEMGYR